MTRFAARVGATVPAGIEAVGQVVGRALEAELVDEPHGPIEIRAFPVELAPRVMTDMGVRPDSPAAAFLEARADGVLIVAIAEVWQ